MINLTQKEIKPLKKALFYSNEHFLSLVRDILFLTSFKDSKEFSPLKGINKVQVKDPSKLDVSITWID